MSERTISAVDVLQLLNLSFKQNKELNKLQEAFQIIYNQTLTVDNALETFVDMELPNVPIKSNINVDEINELVGNPTSSFMEVDVPETVGTIDKFRLQQNTISLKNYMNSENNLVFSNTDGLPSSFNLNNIMPNSQPGGDLQYGLYDMLTNDARYKIVGSGSNAYFVELTQSLPNNQDFVININNANGDGLNFSIGLMGYYINTGIVSSHETLAYNGSAPSSFQLQKTDGSLFESGTVPTVEIFNGNNYHLLKISGASEENDFDIVDNNGSYTLSVSGYDDNDKYYILYNNGYDDSQKSSFVFGTGADVNNLNSEQTESMEEPQISQPSFNFEFKRNSQGKYIINNVTAQYSGNQGYVPVGGILEFSNFNFQNVIQSQMGRSDVLVNNNFRLYISNEDIINTGRYINGHELTVFNVNTLYREYIDVSNSLEVLNGEIIDNREIVLDLITNDFNNKKDQIKAILSLTPEGSLNIDMNNPDNNDNKLDINDKLVMYGNDELGPFVKGSLEITVSNDNNLFFISEPEPVVEMRQITKPTNGRVSEAKNIYQVLSYNLRDDDIEYDLDKLAEARNARIEELKGKAVVMLETSIINQENALTTTQALIRVYSR